MGDVNLQKSKTVVFRNCGIIKKYNSGVTKVNSLILYQIKYIEIVFSYSLNWNIAHNALAKLKVIINLHKLESLYNGIPMYFNLFDKVVLLILC